MRRHLIVNADDFGLGVGVNRGIIESYEQGIVTSSSLMVHAPAAEAAAAYARSHPDLSLGIHITLCEFSCRNGEWSLVYQVVELADREAVAREVRRQLARFCRLVGRTPTHLDTHQHVHRSEPIRSVLLESARALKVPLRHFQPGLNYCGGFYGRTPMGEPLPEAISVAGLMKTIGALPVGWTELVCHPGLGNDEGGDYSAERAQEAAVLRDPSIRRFLEAEDVGLVSFHSSIPCQGLS
jgi:chitin disaccharide deacetylase